MNFKDNKAIYLQIADRIGDQILSGKLMPEGKVPSVRDFTKRGLGYFVSADAKDKIIASRRDLLMQGEMDYFLGQLKAVGITPAELQDLYNDYLNRANASS